MKHMISLILAGLTCGCNSAATDVKDDGNWIQLAKGKQANYEFDLGSTSIEPTLHARNKPCRPLMQPLNTRILLVDLPTTIPRTFT